MKKTIKEKSMNNLKKVGLSALAGSLAAFSANAAEMSVSGSAAVTYNNGNSDEITGNPYGMNTSLGFTGSGDVNEAYTISLEEGFLNAGFKINKVAKEIVDSHRKINSNGFIKPEGLDAIFTSFSPPEIIYTTDQINHIVATSDVGILTLGRNSGEGGDRSEKGRCPIIEVASQIQAKVCFDLSRI